MAANQQIAAGLYNLGILQSKQGDRLAAIESVARATSIFIERKQSQSATAALSFLGTLRYRLGDIAGALAALQQGLEIGKADKVGTIRTLRTIALLRMAQADFAAARARLEEMRRIGAGQDKSLVLAIRQVETDLAFAEGRFAEAAARYHELGVQYAADGEPEDAAESESYGAESRLRIGAQREAEKATALAEAYLRKSKSESELPRALPNMVAAFVRAWRSPARVDASLASLRSIAELCASRGRADDHWHARLLAAEILRHASRPGAEVQLAALARDARAEGFEAYARRAEAALATQK